MRKLFLCFFVLTAFCFQTYAQTTDSIPTPRIDREFRAAWIASVANIDWPSKPGLSTEVQQLEALNLLDMLKRLNFNAVILQVRPQADAFYKSDLEPWSYFLTGTQGQAPDPYYDPLEFWIKEAHKRGLELHVWLNPYRAHHISNKGTVSQKSVLNTHPELVYKLKEGYYWLDPAQQGTQDISAAVVRDIVKRYDIDGVHFDDYFYPYESYNGGKDFPDDKTFAAYQKSGGALNRGDWRRMHVNRFIERIYKEIKEEKQHVKFGLSPFGIWRPGFPASVAGMDQYEVLYADAKLWLNKGWIDYFTPQLYWKISAPAQSFPALLGWWQSENTLQRHLWPGMNVGLGGDEKNSIEVINQIMIGRGMLPLSPGAVHWSIKALVSHERLRNDLLAGPYKKEALVPASPWLGNEKPETPQLTIQDKGQSWNANWQSSNENKVFKYVLYTLYGNQWQSQTLSAGINTQDIPKNLNLKSQEKLRAIAVSAIDRIGNESIIAQQILPTP